jgi:DNA helicase HerA-like ATPase
MMWLLANLYESLAEVGDVDKPKLVFFFDEAHLLFRDANKTFMAQIELVARLIRSKGVGVFFVTHAPTDVPSEVLGQLGNRVQHALRAFTPDDLETVRATADTFPTSEFYDLADELTKLGIGEAIVSALDPKGRPMPAARTMMRPPTSLMAQVGPDVFDAVVSASAIAPTYATDTDPESAKELLAARLKRATEDAKEPMEDVQDPESPGERRMRPTRAPERGVDWGKVATEGGRVVRSGTFNTILRAIFGILGRRR